MPPGHEEHPLVRLDNVPAIQVDFRGKHGPKNFKKKECQLLGTDMDGNLIAAELCISKIESGGIYAGRTITISPAHRITLTKRFTAGIFVCTDGIVDGKCSLTSTSAPNLTTTVHFYRRQTNLLVSKDNYTITSAADFSPAIPAPIADDVEAYRDVLHWLLDYSAANIPPPSSILENFWTAREQLQNPTTDVFFLQAFQGILAFPVWLFNANNYGNDALAEKTMVDPASGLLAPEFYTRASLVRPYLKLKFDPTVLVVFGACQLVVLMFSAVVLAWAAHRAAALPSVSSFPVFDCYFKPEVVRGKEFVDPHRVDVWRAGDSEILELMKNTTVRRKTRGWESPKGWI
jgi:hypothetical protein